MTSKMAEFSQDSGLELMRIAHNALVEYSQNQATSGPALVIGSSSKADIRVNAATSYRRAGIFRTNLSAGEVNIASGATMPDDGTIRSVVVLVTINGSDALATTAGDIARGGQTAAIPDIPAGHVLLGHVRIVAAAGTAFTADSTLLDAAGLTVTFTSVTTPTWLLTSFTRAELGE